MTNKDLLKEIKFLYQSVDSVKHGWLYIFATIFLSISIVAIEAIGLFAIVPILEAIGSKPVIAQDNVLTPLFDLVRNPEGGIALKKVALLLIAVSVAKPVLSFAVSLVSNVFPFRLQTLLVQRVIEEYIGTSMVVLSKEKAVRLNSVCLTFIGKTCSIVGMLSGSITQLFLFLLYCTLMWFVSPASVLITVGFVSTYYFGTRTLANKQATIGKIITERLTNYQQSCLQLIGSIRFVKIVSAEGQVKRDIFGKLDDLISEQFKAIFLASILQPMITLTSGLLIATILYFGSDIFQGPQQNWLGLVILFIVVFQRLLGPASSLYQTRIAIAEHWPSLKEVKRLIDLCEANKMPDGLIDSSDFGGELEVMNLSFKYDNVPTLKDVSFKIPAGTFCAIVGPSGAGKTTLSSLLMRMYLQDEGAIYLGGKDLREFTKNSLSAQIGFVSQSTFLLNDTLRKNFKLVKEDISDSEIWEALSKVGADDFVRELEEGLETNLHEGGSRLSEGQKQRISLARAIVMPRRVLILDETTSNLDSFSEAKIMETILSLKGETTLVVIAHRLSTVQHADSILLFENGEIIESGTHRSLVENDKLYRRMVNLQRFVDDDRQK